MSPAKRLLFTLVLVAIFVFPFFLYLSNGSKIKTFDPADMTFRILPISLERVTAEPALLSGETRIISALKKLNAITEPSRYNAAVHRIHFWASSSNRSSSGEISALCGPFFSTTKSIQQFGLPVQLRTRIGFEYISSIKPQFPGELHAFQTIAALGEAGVASSQTIEVNGEEVPLSDAIRWIANNLNTSLEIEWGVVALGLYLAPGSNWVNKFGQPLDFDVLCEWLCERPLGKGSCFGTHNLYALAVLLLCDEKEKIISTNTRKRAVKYLETSLICLEHSQASSGGWNRNWFGGIMDHHSDEQLPPTHVELLVTGHQLEWLALAPPELAKKTEMIEKASMFLANAILEESTAAIERLFCPFSHAGSALSLTFPSLSTKARLK